MHVRTGLALLIAVLVGGCGLLGEDGEVGLRTDQQQYELPGATVELTLENGTDETIDGKICFARLHRNRGSGEWTALDLVRACTLAEVAPLKPGHSTSITLSLPDSVSVGSYRYHHEYAPDELVRSNSFQLARSD